MSPMTISDEEECVLISAHEDCATTTVCNQRLTFFYVLDLAPLHYI